MNRIAEFPDRLPCKVRCAVALVILELFLDQIDPDWSSALRSFCSLGWKWIEGGLQEPDELYVDFARIHQLLVDLEHNDVPLGQALFVGAYCVLWEAYRAAWVAGVLTDSSRLPSEVCEGDEKLWAEFAEHLAAIERAWVSTRLPQMIERVLSDHAGDPVDRDSRLSRGAFKALLNEL